MLAPLPKQHLSGACTVLRRCPSEASHHLRQLQLDAPTRPYNLKPGTEQVAERLSVPVSTVKNVIIWGNHSSTQYPDVNHGSVGGTPIRKAVDDDAYLDGEFIKVVQQRGAAIIKVRTRTQQAAWHRAQRWGLVSHVSELHLASWLPAPAPGA